MRGAKRNSPLVLAVTALLLASSAMAEPAPPGPAGQGSTSQLAAALRRQPADPRGWVALGRVRAREGQPSEAAECLEQALRLGSREPGLRVELAELYRKTGQGPRAAGLLRQHLKVEPSDTAARELLQRVSSAACPQESLESYEAFEAAARQERCFQVQQLVQMALHERARAGGPKVSLTAENWKAALAGLVGPGMLARPVSEPTTSGMILRDDRGVVACPIHGPVVRPCEEGARPPRLERVLVPETWLERAMRSGEGALRMGAALLVRRGAVRDAPALIGLGLQGERDGWTLLALLSSVSPGSHSKHLEGALQPFLEHADQEVRQATARALAALGAQPTMALGDAMALMRRAADGEVPEEFVLQVFETLGVQAVPALVEALLEPSSGITTPMTLRVMERLPDRRVVTALVEALGRPEQKFAFFRPDVRHALRVLSGQDFGGSPDAWRGWLRRTYPR